MKKSKPTSSRCSSIIRRGSWLLCLLLMLSAFCWAQQDPSGYPQQFEGDWNVPDFTFHSGEKLAPLHYITLGSPERDAAGHVRNAVLILHGTGGTGRNFCPPSSAPSYSAKASHWMQPATARLRAPRRLTGPQGRTLELPN